jgi:hypothetical protein
MKRIIGVIVAGVIAFSGVYALAASLSVTSNQLGAGVTTVAACQGAATLNATYVPSYQSSVPGYSAGTVTLNNLASTCWNVPYKVTLTNAGASLSEVTGTTPVSGTTLVVTFTGVNAASVTGVAVVLGG